jgi:hypothetical protein
MRGRRAGALALLAAGSLLLGFQLEAPEEMAPELLETQAYPTALESYLERPGILLVTRHHPLAPVALRGGRELRLDAITAYEPGMQHQRVMGIRIQIEGPELAAEERVFYLDVHEIEELVRAIDVMRNAIREKRRAPESEQTEMSIATLDGLRLEVRFTAGGASAYLRTPATTLDFPPAALETLGARLEAGRAHLFAE